DDARRARSRPSLMAAGLERDIQRSAARAVAGFVERKDLGVGLSGPRMMALADDDAVGRHDDRPHHRVRRGRALAAPGVEQRASHQRLVGHHFSMKSASTYSEALNGSRSSMPSPTPTYRM